MSFVHPERLVLLVGVAALAVALAAVVLRRRQAVARYTNPDLYDRLVPERTGWRGLVGPILALVALALVVVSVAQPTRLERVPREQGVVVLAIDVSLSMTATDIEPSRLEAAIAGASSFVDELPDGIDVGLVAFDGDARLLVLPTDDHATVTAAIATLSTDERTATGEAVYTSLQAVADAQAAEGGDGTDVPASIVLLSDGVATVGRSLSAAAGAAVEAEIPITTIAYGTPEGSVVIDGQAIGVPADTASMIQVADATGGTYFEATSAGELRDVYTDIQTTIGYEQVPVDVSRAWLGAAFVVLLVAAGWSLATTTRAL
ncbi:MAG: VWA domain-containing protein [Acidimicrobiales bacterium]|nr:VWA domain-containing protein [Acidimicrobiales bacterium]